MQTFYSNGKLLLTGEYAVLNGALSLAVPTTFGQSLRVTPNNTNKISWKSIDNENLVWFEGVFDISNNDISCYTENDCLVSKRLLQILKAVKQLNPELLSSGYNIESKLTFPRNWGLGTSSTLINNIASWTQIDAYKLLEKTFGGSGYDIACAQNKSAITYQLKDNTRQIETINYNPDFSACLYLVYLNKKQNSQEAIKQYNSNSLNNYEAISEISVITLKIMACNNLIEFEQLMNTHEQIISSLIKQQTIKENLFPDFKGCIKSLGAWGGDFVLVSSKTNPSAYFKAKGFETILSYSDMVL